MKSTTKTWKIFGILGTIIIFLIAWLLALSPILDGMNKTTLQISEQERNKLVQTKKLAQIKAIEDTSGLKSTLQVLDKEIPSTISDVEFMSQLQSAVRSSGVEIAKVTIDSKQTVSKDQSTSFPISILGSGTSGAATSFIGKVQTLDRLMVITSVTVSSQADLIKFTINGTIFSFGK